MHQGDTSIGSPRGNLKIRVGFLCVIKVMSSAWCHQAGRCCRRKRGSCLLVWFKTLPERKAKRFALFVFFSREFGFAVCLDGDDAPFVQKGGNPFHFRPNPLSDYSPPIWHVILKQLCKRGGKCGTGLQESLYSSVLCTCPHLGAIASEHIRIWKKTFFPIFKWQSIIGGLKNIGK